MKKLIASILIVLLMIPTVAFAESTHTLSELDLTVSDHSDKTLENDGYTWDAENAVLTLQDISVGGDIILPKKDCTINVQGECYVGCINRDGDSGAAQSVTINGAEGAKLWAKIDVSGALTLNDLTMTDGSISNGSSGDYPDFVLTLQDSTINLRSLSWMPDAGIDLHNSKLNVVMAMPDGMPQFWVEMIAMDEKSEIVSDTRLINYGHCDLADFGEVLNYVVEPEGGRFAQPGDAITIITEVEGELAPADHFVLRASTGGSEEGPGDGGDEDGTGGSTGGDTTGGETDGGSKNPATGDSGVVLYIAIAVVAVGGAAAVIVCRNKKKDN